jgi:hypothetical protein
MSDENANAKERTKIHDDLDHRRAPWLMPGRAA